MIKLIIFVVLGLVAGIGGGAAMSVMKAKGTYADWQAKKAEQVADSLAKAEEHLAAGGADSAHAPDSSAHGADSAVANAAHATDAGTEASHDPPREAHVKPAAPKSAHVAAAPPTHTPSAPKTVESHGTAKGETPPPPALPFRPLVKPLPGSANEKMSKIFGAMPPKDAAKVLAQLSDSEVHAIVSGLSDKQAAGILQNLPADKAAAISKLVLRGGSR